MSTIYQAQPTFLHPLLALIFIHHTIAAAATTPALPPRCNTSNIMFSITFILCTIILVLVFSKLFDFLRTSSRKVYLVDFSCYKPQATMKCPDELMLDRLRRFITSYNEDTLNNMRDVCRASGLGPSTYVPKALLEEPPRPCLAGAREETQAVIFGVVDELLMVKARGVRVEEIGIVIVNCSIFCPVPSLCDMIVNRYKLKESVLSYDISGMGCSAGLYGIGFAKQLLQVHENSYALIVSTEGITENLYTGNEYSMIMSNCVFRVGGSAILLSNRPTDKEIAKYKLIHTVHTNIASSDPAYNCIFQDEDSKGHRGIRVTKDLLVEASNAIRANLAAVGLLILPESDMLLFSAHYLAKQFRTKKNYQPYTPNFKGAIDHFCPHVGGKPVLDSFQKTLKLSAKDMEAARMTLYTFGNTSSSSIWYELAYIEAKGRIKKGDRLWQIAYGSGFKCTSVIWRAIATVGKEESNPWSDEIDEFPICLDHFETLSYFAEHST
ncbi:3-ketoacyl-CoA synthase 2-like protein [Drosera capensis]